MKSLFDILLDQILSSEKEAEKEAAKARKKAKKGAKDEKETAEEDTAKAKTLEEQAKAEVKRRAKKKLEEAFKKSEEKMAEALAKQKRKKRGLERSMRDEEARHAFEESLVAPTARLQWKSAPGNIHHLHAFIGGEHMFDIQRGVASYKLSLMDPRLKDRLSLKQRAKKVGMGNIFSSINVYSLKDKAEKLLSRIELLEKQAVDKAKKPKQ